MGAPRFEEACDDPGGSTRSLRQTSICWSVTKVLRQMTRMPENHRDPLNDIDRESIYWLTLALRLPRDGVRSAFPTEAACLRRLQEVRWPDGVTCEKCGSKDIGLLSTRSVFQCRTCRVQSSVTSGTIMHRSHLPALMWFAGAERLIQARAFPSRDRDIINRDMADYLGVQYEAGWRIKKKLLADLSPAGSGLIRDAICKNTLQLPGDLEIGTTAHLRWLGEQLRPSEPDFDFESMQELFRKML